MADQLLNLDTLVDRDTVRVDGVDYEMRNLDELDMLQYRRLEIKGARMSSLMDDVDNISEDEAQELDDITHALLHVCMVDLPAQVADKLTQSQRFQIIDCFISRSSKDATKASKAKKGTKSKRSTTQASTSRSSSASTAATPSGG